MAATRDHAENSANYEQNSDVEADNASDTGNASESNEEHADVELGACR